MDKIEGEDALYLCARAPIALPVEQLSILVESLALECKLARVRWVEGKNEGVCPFDAWLFWVSFVQFQLQNDYPGDWIVVRWQDGSSSRLPWKELYLHSCDRLDREDLSSWFADEVGRIPSEERISLDDLDNIDFIFQAKLKEQMISMVQAEIDPSSDRPRVNLETLFVDLV